MIFADATLEGCELFRFRWSKKLVVYFGLYEFFFLVFQRIVDQKNTILKK